MRGKGQVVEEEVHQGRQAHRSAMHVLSSIAQAASTSWGQHIAAPGGW